jgi:hypothetical protein
LPDALVQLLVDDGAVAPAGVERALARQAEAGGTLDTALLELRLIDEARLVETMARAAKIPPAPPEAFERPDPRARRVFPSKVAERHGLAPFALDDRELRLAAEYPVNSDLLDEIAFMLSLDLKPFAATAWKVRELIHRQYGTSMPSRLAALAEQAHAPEAQPSPHAAPRPPAPEARGPSAAAGPPPPAGDASPPAGKPAPAASGTGGPAVERPPATAGPGRPVAPPPAARVEAAAEPPPGAPGRPFNDGSTPRWTLELARAALGAARSRDDVVKAALRYARDFFEYAAVFAITRDVIWGHDAIGLDEEARDRCRGVAVGMEQPSFFRQVIEVGAPYLGPVPADPMNEAILRGLGRASPRTVLLYPVMLRQRPVCVLLADNGAAPVSARRLGDLLLLASALGPALERVLRARKDRGERRPPPSETWRTSEPALAEAPAVEAVDVDLGDYEVGPASQALAGPRPFEVPEAVEQLLRSVRGSPDRANLVAQLARRGAEAAAALCARFPGPIEVKSDALAEATPVFEQGPVLAALAALGTSATESLLPLLQDPDPERRRCAVLLLAHVGDPAAFPELAARAFDSHSRVSAAARGALASLRRRPEMQPVAERLRQALVSPIIERSAQAARALGRLGDVEAIPLLIQRLESGDRVAVEAASDALSRIAVRRMGPHPDRWRAWWKENRNVPRMRWLLAALEDPDRDLRQAAAEELRTSGAPPVPYSPDASPAERQRAGTARRRIGP